MDDGSKTYPDKGYLNHMCILNYLYWRAIILAWISFVG